MATELIPEDTPIYPLEECKRFIQDCLQAAGACKANAAEHADAIVAADYRGHYSHGMNRLEMYTSDLERGFTDGGVCPVILKEGPATAWVDGRNGLGAVVGNFCMQIAIKKAKEIGVGWVVAKRCTHYGMAGWYSIQALEEGLIGYSCTNTVPRMTPTRAHHAALGTNPVAFAAPGNSDSFELDMATTVVPLGKIQMAKRNNTPIPLGWAMDAAGNETEDAATALNDSLLLPLGGTEATRGYKGYGLALMVDVMSGILGGANYGLHISKQTESPNLGQCFFALDPNCFAPDFQDRMSDMMNLLRNMEPLEGENPVLVHGDKEKMHMKAVDAAGGVKYSPDQLDTCDRLSKKFNVTPMRCKCVHTCN